MFIESFYKRMQLFDMQQLAGLSHEFCLQVSHGVAAVHIGQNRDNGRMKDQIVRRITDPVPKKQHFLPGMFYWVRFQSIPKLRIITFNHT